MTFSLQAVLVSITDANIHALTLTIVVVLRFRVRVHAIRDILITSVPTVLLLYQTILYSWMPRAKLLSLPLITLLLRHTTYWKAASSDAQITMANISLAVRCQMIMFILWNISKAACVMGLRVFSKSSDFLNIKNVLKSPG